MPHWPDFLIMCFIVFVVLGIGRLTPAGRALARVVRRALKPRGKR